MVDAQKQTLNCLVGNGSKGRVLARPWEINRNGQDFKGLELMAVQVVELVSYESNPIDAFDVIEIDSYGYPSQFMDNVWHVMKPKSLLILT